MVIDHFAWFSTLFVLNYTVRQFCGRCNIERILYSHANELFWGLSMVSKYSKTPPYGHLGIIRSPRYYGHSILAAWQNGKLFLKKKTLLIPVNAAIFFGPLLTVLTEFHCSLS